MHSCCCQRTGTIQPCYYGSVSCRNASGSSDCLPTRQKFEPLIVTHAMPLSMPRGDATRPSSTNENRSSAPITLPDNSHRALSACSLPYRYRNQLRRGFSGLRRTDSAPAECTGAKYDDEFQNCNPPRNDTTFWPRARALPLRMATATDDDARGPAKTKTRKPVAQYFTDCFRTARTDCRVSVGFAVKFSRFRPIAIAQASGAAKIQKSRRAIKYRHGTFHELLNGCVRCVTMQRVGYM